MGAYIYYALSKKSGAFIINKSIYIGETLLLGNIVLAGEFLLLSLAGLYNAACLWMVIPVNCLFLLNRRLRSQIREVVFSAPRLSIPKAIFCVLALLLIFRNLYFMFDVDSMSTYLFTQKLWLSSGSSLRGGPETDVRVFLPQFDNLPSSLGLALFPQETLFPQLINLFWRLVVILLAFGYSAFRFGGYAGLAAVMFIVFDSHFFYSGINRWVLITSALIALLFAAAYNFWEARIRDSGFRFLLGLIFSAQFIANKYQMAYFCFFIAAIAFLIQPSAGKRFSEIAKNRRWLFAFWAGVSIMLLWYFKNLLVTGIPTFPIFSGKMRIFGWTSEQGSTFVKLFGGITPGLFVKYMNYFFIWPGVTPAKYLILGISFLPLLFLFKVNAQNKEKTDFFELCYWLGLSVLAILGICLSSHQDPRYYRYPIAIFSFSAVLLLYYILRYLLRLRQNIFMWLIILFAAVPGYGIILHSGGNFSWPTINENLQVLFNKIHTDYAVKKHYPHIPLIINEIGKGRDKFMSAAWDMGTGVNFPAFLLPIRPQISPWLSTIIKWDSYADENAVENDLREAGIVWVMTLQEDKFTFLPVEEYARNAVKYERKPTKIFYDYNFPKELSEIRY
jgi:hypothetical protein